MVATDLLACVLIDTARPPRRRHRRRVRRSASACRWASVARTPRSSPPATRPARALPGRLVGVSTDTAGPSGAAPRAADPRAAHPPREGHLEHLHRAGAAGQHRRAVRRVARTERPAADRRARPPAHLDRRRGVRHGGHRAASTTRGSTRLQRARRRRRRPPPGDGRRASICGTCDADTVGISFDETSTIADGRGGARGACGGRRVPTRLRRRRARRPERPAPTGRDPHPAGVQPLPHRARDAALPAPPRRPRSGARPHDDPARLVHDEAQRHRRDDADHVARVRRHPSVTPPTSRPWATAR